MLVVAAHRVEGHVSHGFDAVRDAFADNFARRRELGGACCAYHRGQKVVDLWGGIRNKQTSEPWEQNTMVLVYRPVGGARQPVSPTTPIEAASRRRVLTRTSGGSSKW
jgi:Beta-lactamase